MIGGMNVGSLIAARGSSSWPYFHSHSAYCPNIHAEKAVKASHPAIANQRRLNSAASSATRPKPVRACGM